jgi:hypothetical protein
MRKKIASILLKGLPGKDFRAYGFLLRQLHPFFYFIFRERESAKFVCFSPFSESLSVQAQLALEKNQFFGQMPYFLLH